jgi:hypothetical protein
MNSTPDELTGATTKTGDFPGQDAGARMIVQAVAVLNG